MSAEAALPPPPPPPLPALSLVGVSDGAGVALLGVPLPPPAAGVGVAPLPRFVTGRLRVATALLPARPVRVSIHFFGTTNGAKDAAAASAAAAEDCVDINLVIWMREAEDLVDGVHEFPFSLQISSNILPSYNFLLSSMPFNQNFDSASPAQAQRQSRSYELVASVLCEDNTLVMSHEPCPIIVRQCYPRWLAGDERVGRGSTAGGEFNVSITIPRFVFLEDGEVDIYVTILDGTELVKNVTAVRCYLVETAAFKVPSQHIPIPIPIGALFRYKVPSQHPLDKFPLFSPQNPLKITLKLAESRADLSTLLLQLTHSLVFEFVYKTGTSVSGLNPASDRRPRGGNAGSVGSSSRAHSTGTSGSTQNSVIIDPLRTIQMIHEALDKRSNLSRNNSDDSPVSAPVSKTQRLKASIIVPVRIVHAVPMDDVGLVNAFGGFAPPPPPVAANIPGSLALETPLTVRVGYEPSTDWDGDGAKELVDQLRMAPGDQVIIDETFDDGWAVGTNLTTGMAGLFPVTVVKFIPTAAIGNTQVTRQPTVPLPPPQQAKSDTDKDKETEKRILKEQLDQMEAMMAAMRAKLDSL
ncbi:hypothetical protein BDR26DRAFT_893308 [Obelidium mucronatum]|nr:hypothetical protein BDR26DRAFT_893308 [Obelidium mucronatum]